MTDYEYEKECDVEALSGEILTGMGYRVKADAANDSVNGYVQGNDSDTCVTFYDSGEAPTSEHDTTLVATSLTQGEIDDLDTIVGDHIP